MTLRLIFMGFEFQWQSRGVRQLWNANCRDKLSQILSKLTEMLLIAVHKFIDESNLSSMTIGDKFFGIARLVT